MSAQEKPKKFTFDQEFPDKTNMSLKNGPSTEELIEQARTEGFEKGLNQGQSQTTESFQQEFTTHLSRLEEALINIERAQNDHFQILHKQTVKLTANLLQKMLGEAAEKFPEDVLSQNVERVLSGINADTAFMLNVHPSTSEFMQNLIENNDNFSKLTMEIKADASLAPGDCMANWDTGGIDGRLEQLLMETQTLLELATATPVDVPESEPAEELDAPSPDAEAQEAAPEAEKNIAPEATEQEAEEETQET